MIKSFGDKVAKKVFEGEALTQKELRKLGGLTIEKTQERLLILDESIETDLLQLPYLHYHHLQGTNRYSIDANSRHSKWRITFEWTDEELRNVELVKIDNTHK